MIPYISPLERVNLLQTRWFIKALGQKLWRGFNQWDLSGPETKPPMDKPGPRGTMPQWAKRGPGSIHSKPDQPDREGPCSYRAASPSKLLTRVISRQFTLVWQLHNKLAKERHCRFRNSPLNLDFEQVAFSPPSQKTPWYIYTVWRIIV